MEVVPSSYRQNLFLDPIALHFLNLETSATRLAQVLLVSIFIYFYTYIYIYQSPQNASTPADSNGECAREERTRHGAGGPKNGEQARRLHFGSLVGLEAAVWS